METRSGRGLGRHQTLTLTLTLNLFLEIQPYTQIYMFLGTSTSAITAGDHPSKCFEINNHLVNDILCKVPHCL